MADGGELPSYYEYLGQTEHWNNPSERGFNGMGDFFQVPEGGTHPVTRTTPVDEWGWRIPFYSEHRYLWDDCTVPEDPEELPSGWTEEQIFPVDEYTERADEFRQEVKNHASETESRMAFDGKLPGMAMWHCQTCGRALQIEVDSNIVVAYYRDERCFRCVRCGRAAQLDPTHIYSDRSEYDCDLCRRRLYSTEPRFSNSGGQGDYECVDVCIRCSSTSDGRELIQERNCRKLVLIALLPPFYNLGDWKPLGRKNLSDSRWIWLVRNIRNNGWAEIEVNGHYWDFRSLLPLPMPEAAADI